MEGKRLIKNTLFLTLTSLSLRLFGLAFQVLLSRKMGAEGLGLFSLVMSLYGFLATLAISGVRFATIRAVSENVGAGKEKELRNLVRSGLNYALLCGSGAALLLFGLSGIIGKTVIGDGRAVLSLKILAFSLPFISTGACLSGYFTGVCRVVKPTAVSIAQELLRFSVSYILISALPHGNVELISAAVVQGNVIGEMFSFFSLYILYRFDIRKTGDGGQRHSEIKRLGRIAVPLALSAYARTALNSVQNLLIPKGLEKSGNSKERALSEYGKIQGMVFPVMTFPSAVFSSLAEMLVPELTVEQVRGRDDRIGYAANKLLKAAMIFSFFITAILFALSDELGLSIYSDIEVGRYIRYLSLLMPIMYMDTVTDGMLRGLGQQLYSMRLNILDSVITSILIWLLLPYAEVKGYIIILYISELFNFSMSILRLGRLTKLKDLGTVFLKSAFSAAGAANLSAFAIKAIGFNGEGLRIAFGALMITVFYSVLVYSLGLINKSEYKKIKKVMGIG